METKLAAAAVILVGILALTVPASAAGRSMLAKDCNLGELVNSGGDGFCYEATYTTSNGATSTCVGGSCRVIQATNAVVSCGTVQQASYYQFNVECKAAGWKIVPTAQYPQTGCFSSKVLDGKGNGCSAELFSRYPSMTGYYLNYYTISPTGSLLELECGQMEKARCKECKASANGEGQWVDSSTDCSVISY